MLAGLHRRPSPANESQGRAAMMMTMMMVMMDITTMITALIFLTDGDCRKLGRVVSHRCRPPSLTSWILKDPSRPSRRPLGGSSALLSAWPGSQSPRWSPRQPEQLEAWRLGAAASAVCPNSAKKAQWELFTNGRASQCINQARSKVHRSTSTFYRPFQQVLPVQQAYPSSLNQQHHQVWCKLPGVKMSWRPCHRIMQLLQKALTVLRQLLELGPSGNSLRCQARQQAFSAHTLYPYIYIYKYRYPYVYIISYNHI